MASSDPVGILLAHDSWATRKILDACAGLSEEQLHRRFDMGPGSLHDTLSHMLGAIRGWGDLLAGRADRPRVETLGRQTVAGLGGLLDEITGDFAASARAHPLEETVSRERGGKRYTFTRGAVITHVATHGMHHRAQCLNMLRRVGVEKMPLSSVMEWTIHTDQGTA